MENLQKPASNVTKLAGKSSDLNSVLALWCIATVKISANVITNAAPAFIRVPASPPPPVCERGRPPRRRRQSFNRRQAGRLRSLPLRQCGDEEGNLTQMRSEREVGRSTALIK